jgi:hypothetical protein
MAKWLPELRDNPLYQADWTRSRMLCSKQIHSMIVILFCSGPCVVTWHCKQLRPQVHSQYSLPGSSHLLCRLVKNLQLRKGFQGMPSIFVYCSLIYRINFHYLFIWNWYFIGTVTKFVHELYTNVTERRLVTNNTPISYVIDPRLKSRSWCRSPDWGVYGVL